MAGTLSRLPHWDMTVVYPGLETTEFAAGFAAVVQGLDRLSDLFETLNIGKREPAPLDAEIVQAFDTVTNRINSLLEEIRTLSAYVASFTATDSRDAVAQAKLSELQQQSVRLSQLNTRYTAWIGSLDVEGLIERSDVARDHAFMLRQTKIEAEHLMSPEEENLASELRLIGGMSWAKLHNNLTSQLLVSMELDGKRREMTMSEVRNMAFEQDRETRRKAYEAELDTWKHNALPIAASLNSVKGETNTLSRRRGWDSALDEAIFDSNIDRQTLDAMMEAARESFPDFRRYLRAKAGALGLERLAWYDMFAPVGASTSVWEYDDAVGFIIEQFGAYSSKMSDFAARAFREQWVDAEPRPGKRDGAFCMPLREDQSRVFTNYKPAYGGMSTLAHELGHAYHNLVKADRTPFQRQTPMTLAETASIFCETIVREAALGGSDRQEQLSILEASLQDNCQVVVDISSRFLFESRVFVRRKERELSIEEFNSLMLESQRETYGDGLDETRLHPYMWAVKSHYYRTDLSFYNFPYMFGLLFGLGLYARYKEDPEAFKTGYDDLLSSTGMADAADLASRFGIDVRTPDFWRASLDIIRADIDRFEELVAQ